MVKLLDKFCRCIELETFGYIVGWLTIINSALTILSLIFFQVFVNSHQSSAEFFGRITDHFTEFIWYLHKDLGFHIGFSYLVGWAFLIGSIYFGYLFIHGISSKQQSYMLPLIISETVGALVIGLIFIFYFLYLVVMFVFGKISFTFTWGLVISFIILLIFIGITFYYFLSVFSLYSKIGSNELAKRRSKNINYQNV
ncbi:hypothetical protein PVAND_017339 [Polypedilum vanderplanki]|uniref:Uncharacterized protein n=1 Tax=Polypedilum vanderplanki TaxID=319348 RepID=A0A9J6BHZ2_POLVA|nr:hypothetical protein PVAND_017339 [Polypedilum vanderplanki]